MRIIHIRKSTILGLKAVEVDHLPEKQSEELELEL